MANNCGNCKFREVESYEEPCSSCRCTSGGAPTKWVSQHEPQTNADRIRAMSDEELAKFIPDWSYTGACKCDEQSYVDCNNECEKCVVEWLKQPAESERL